MRGKRYDEGDCQRGMSVLLVPLCRLGGAYTGYNTNNLKKRKKFVGLKKNIYFCLIKEKDRTMCTCMTKWDGA